MNGICIVPYGYSPVNKKKRVPLSENPTNNFRSFYSMKKDYDCSNICSISWLYPPVKENLLGIKKPPLLNRQRWQLPKALMKIIRA